MLDEFFDAYVTAALWSSTDDNCEPLDAAYSADDIAPETLEAMRADCSAFIASHAADIQCEGAPHGRDGSDPVAMAGHDFWLTRCGHGAGFWDGDWPEPHAKRMDATSKKFGNVDLYVGDDGKIHA